MTWIARVLPIAIMMQPAQSGEQVAEQPPSANYETVLVVLETELGDFTVSLEIERAPITAANFLRYVDERRDAGPLA